MMAVECNFPRTTGYSAAVIGGKLCMLHAHREGGGDPECDWVGSQSHHWVYMPIGSEEYVTEIWVSAVTSPEWQHKGDEALTV